MGKTAILGVSIAALLAFVFLVPAAQVNFWQPPMTESCTNSAGQLTSLCGHILVKGYGSISYWLFGAGGLYNSITSQYSFTL
jgi:hypothetical protein